jgi:hypothetical protein
MARMKGHDKLAKILGMILTRLNTGERLCLPELASEFNVSERTLQRYLNSRLGYRPIEREGATYFINLRFLGRQSAKDISALLSGMRVELLFPCNCHSAPESLLQFTFKCLVQRALSFQ